MNKKYLALGITLLIVSISLFILIMTNLSYEKKEMPCVDGDGDINLEGIMCNKEIQKFFGLEAGEASEVLAIIILIDVSLLLIGLIFTFILGLSKNE